MPKKFDYDAVIVGAGPNGLAAAITLARAGCSTLVLEGKDTIGGGARSMELTRPGFIHDVCSAIHPLGVGSPFFRSIPLGDFGLEWVYSPLSFAHPLDGGRAVVLERSIEATAGKLGADGAAYRRLMSPMVSNWKSLLDDTLGPLSIPRHPFLLARFGLVALQSASGLSRRLFRGEEARALFAGLAAHSILPLEHGMTAAIGLMEGILGHAVGWPMARGGSQAIIDAMAAYLQSMGGVIQTGVSVKSLKDLPSARATLLNVTPKQLLSIAGDRLPAGYRGKLERYRYGPGVFKIDYALDGPAPWQAPECEQAATLHLGGTLEEIAYSESAIWRGEHAENPFLILVQHSPFDRSRAPEGGHTAWVYCHVPSGSTVDMTGRIEAQIERFAPGFRERILDRYVRGPAEFEAYNPNYVGGDIIGGVQDLAQQFARPTLKRVPYAIPVKGLYLCSSSTPPGGGVHGMCGYFAAKAALRGM
ncbi:MAG TPA: NAD(P)/FAD-dependent oxidoreductase [Anaerolineales bacterium]|nr:NAD(P)/FAD-dependent oxidoreductase [Anaerolineales bacterium]